MEKEKRKLENFQYHKKIDISAGCVKEKKERRLMVQRGRPLGAKGHGSAVGVVACWRRQVV